MGGRTEWRRREVAVECLKKMRSVKASDNAGNEDQGGEKGGLPLIHFVEPVERVEPEGPVMAEMLEISAEKRPRLGLYSTLGMI